METDGPLICEEKQCQAEITLLMENKDSSPGSSLCLLFFVSFMILCHFN